MLLDKAATKSGILAAFERLRQQVLRTDHFILIAASDGIALNDAFCLVTRDYEGALDETNLIGSDELVSLSKRISALNQLFVLDACHSSRLAETMRVFYDARLSTLARKMGFHIHAAAQTRDGALDGYRGNGLFTYHFLKGLNDNRDADRNRDDAVSIVELGNYAEAGTRSIAREKKIAQEPIILDYGEDRVLYRLRQGKGDCSGTPFGYPVEAKDGGGYPMAASAKKMEQYESRGSQSGSRINAEKASYQRFLGGPPEQPIMPGMLQVRMSSAALSRILWEIYSW